MVWAFCLERSHDSKLFLLKELLFFQDLWEFVVSRLARAPALVGVPGADLGVGDLHVVEAGVAGHAKIVAGHLKCQGKVSKSFFYFEISEILPPARSPAECRTWVPGIF